MAQGDKVDCLYDDAPHYCEIHGVPVYKASETHVSEPLIISIGSNRVRKRISERYPIEYGKAIHPQAIISPTVTIGRGTVVMHNALIQADTKIGDHCIINSASSIDHECVIGDFVHISPHATLCGNVHVGEGSWIGAGAVVIPGIRIGRWCTIGAGSVVIRDIPDGVTAYGNPCKIKEQDMQTSKGCKMINPKSGGGRETLEFNILYSYIIMTYAA